MNELKPTCSFVVGATLALRMPAEDARAACVPVPHSFPSTLNRNHNHFGHAASGR